MKQIIITLVLFSFSSVYAQTFNLEPGTSIQGTIDQAQNGDEIILAPGKYEENIDFLGKAISIFGAGKSTILSPATNTKATINFVSGETNSTVISDLRLTRSQGREAISIIDSSPVIKNCFIDRNYSNTRASGIAINGQAAEQAALIRNNVIALNRALDRDSDPHQIDILNASPQIENNTIVRGDSNAVFIQGDSSPTIVNNILAYNGRGSRGRGICLVSLSNNSSTNINHNLFFRNKRGDIFIEGVDYKNIEKAQELETLVALPFTLASNIHAHPRFKKLRRIKNLDLRRKSQARDAGNPDSRFNDKDDSRNDIGYTGGQGSSFSSVSLF